jgi:hypothetical protein
MGSEINLGQKYKVVFETQVTEKRTGGRAQVIEYLSSKHKTLSSDPSTTKTYLMCPI